MPIGRYALGLCSCAHLIGAIGRHFLRRSTARQFECDCDCAACAAMNKPTI